MGVYINQDPSGLSGGMNFFAYVNGNPLNHTDPEGLQAVGSEYDYISNQSPPITAI